MIFSLIVCLRMLRVFYDDVIKLWKTVVMKEDNQRIFFKIQSVTSSYAYWLMFATGHGRLEGKS